MGELFGGPLGGKFSIDWHGFIRNTHNLAIHISSVGVERDMVAKGFAHAHFPIRTR